LFYSGGNAQKNSWPFLVIYLVAMTLRETLLAPTAAAATVIAGPDNGDNDSKNNFDGFSGADGNLILHVGSLDEAAEGGTVDLVEVLLGQAAGEAHAVDLVEVFLDEASESGVVDLVKVFLGHAERHAAT
jgi:hypothetical protein